MSQASSQARSQVKRKWLRWLVWSGCFIGACLGILLLIGVWLPDVIFAPVHTLAEQRLASGYHFRVVQYWNHIDFYTIELRITSPDGKTTIHTLDGDASKRWQSPLVIDELQRTVATNSGSKVSW